MRVYNLSEIVYSCSARQAATRTRVPRRSRACSEDASRFWLTAWSRSSSVEIYEEVGQRAGVVHVGDLPVLGKGGSSACFAFRQQGGPPRAGR